MRVSRKVAAALIAECDRRGLPRPAGEVVRAYAVAAALAGEAASELACATGAARREPLSVFTKAVRQMLAIRASVGLSAGERRVYTGVRAARAAAAQALGDDSIFSPLPPPRTLSKPN